MVTINTLLMEVINIPGAFDVFKKYMNIKSDIEPNESLMQSALCYPLFIVFQQLGINENTAESIIEEINKLKASDEAVAQRS